MQFDPEIKEVIRQYFTFSRREYKAALAVFILTLVVWCFSDLKNYFYPPSFDNVLIAAKAKELDSIQGDSDIENPSADNNYSPDQKTRERISSPSYFEFNPNTASEEDLFKLGLSKKQIHIIKNYISKVGEIKSKADFKKIYGIPSDQFEALAPYINLPEATPVKAYNKSEMEKKETRALSIELNTADSFMLDELPGIGMGYARRIIKYRTALGGFIDLSQLMEVYGFRETLLDTIAPFLTLDVTKITKLNVNTATIDELKKHPYIKYKLGNAIVNYRTQHGSYNTVEDIKNIALVTDELFAKIKPYLAID